MSDAPSPKKRVRKFSTRRTVKKAPRATELALRRWCVEQAARWPTYSGNAGVYSAGGMYKETEADLLGRAERILAWVIR